MELTYPEYIFGKKTVKQYCGSKTAPLHPNRISAFGALSTTIGSTLIHNPYTLPVGISLITVGDTIADYYDGKYARKYSLATKEGSKLDPLADKIKNISVGTSVAIIEGITNPLSLIFGLSILTDYVSQRQRGPILEQIIEAKNAIIYPEFCKTDTEKKSNLRANKFGKYKTALQAGVHIGYAISLGIKELPLSEIYLNYSTNFFNIALPTTLTISTILGSIGVYKRIKNK